jgi:hypothetical protein
MGSRPLLRAEGVAGAADSKTVRVLALDVPEGVAVLSLAFDYAPRKSLDEMRNTELVEGALAHHHKSCAYVAHAKPEEERLAAERAEVKNHYRELHNLMNVVLIDPEGRWRGRWDRNPSSDGGALYLGRDRASKGFIPGAIVSGRWQVAIECHGIFGAPVRWQVAVDACETIPADAFGETTTHPGDAAREPPIPKRRYYFGEMHSHTFHSDGRNDVFELAAKAKALGIDFVALTDHNTMSGLLELEEAVKNGRAQIPVTIVPGCELTTFHGHHPIYGVKELVPWHRDGRVLPLDEIAPVVRAAGGIVSVAHPFKLGDPICTGCRMPDGLSPKSFDLMEVWYRRWDAAESDNEAAYALWNRYWSEGQQVTAVAARDWHGPSQEKPFPGQFPFTGVHAASASVEDLLEGLARGRVIMSGGPILDLVLATKKGGQAAIGGTLVTKSPAIACVSIERLEGAAELRLFRRGEIATRLAVEGEGDYEIEGYAEEPGWYRAELWRDDEPLVITNHVVVRG